MNVRFVPEHVVRLPTLCLDIKKNLDVNVSDVSFFDETKNVQVAENSVHRTFFNTLLDKIVMVIPLSINNDFLQVSHCNCIIITQKTIERFEPRGNIHLQSQTTTVQNLYSPEKIDTYIRQLLRSWCVRPADYPLRQFQLECRVRGISYSTYPQYIRYFKPLLNGITSTDTNVYKNAQMCQTLVFNYIRIRVDDEHINEHRSKAHKDWLHNERKH
jgi:hypothetical protein